MENIKKVVENLNARGFRALEARTPSIAKEIALSLVGGSSVGFGGSVTVDGLGVYDELLSRGNDVYWHWKGGGEMRRKAATADFYICSANALTVDGILMLTDGGGNRVSALSFGPRNAIVIVGRNKLVKDISEGFARIKSGDCSGKNAARLNLKTPCAVTGECSDCGCADRICSVTALFERPPKSFDNFYVVLVDGDMGY